MPVSKVFGENLRLLCRRRGTIAGVARDLGINKVQFHRYLNGQSYPKPRVLSEICAYFGVDARIMLERLNDHGAQGLFAPTGRIGPREGEFPDGFYAVTLMSAQFPDQALRMLRMVRTGPRGCIMSGVVPRVVLHRLNGLTGLNFVRHDTEVTRVEQGLFGVIERQRIGTVTFEYWHQVVNAQRPIWLGMSVFATAETAVARRAVRFIMEPIPGNCATVLGVARRTGYVKAHALEDYEKLLLKPGAEFR